MTQRDRDRLVALKKAKKKLITQKFAAGDDGQVAIFTDIVSLPCTQCTDPSNGPSRPAL